MIKVSHLGKKTVEKLADDDRWCCSQPCEQSNGRGEVKRNRDTALNSDDSKY
jgi:hypothetical protein